MELSLKNYKNLLPKEFIKKAGKMNVRECDEISKGHFQAYVDENDNSFDVAVSLNDKEEIIDHSCDCKNKSNFCLHKTALLSFIVNGKKDKLLIKSNKKVSQLDVLIEEVAPEKLKDWIKELLLKNKDLELAFIHQFTNQQKNYTPADVKRLTQEAAKAVIKNRKKAEAGEVKKIVELWTDIHVELVNQYCAHVTDKDAFLNFHTLIVTGQEIKSNISTSSNRFSKYLQSQLLKVTVPLQELQTDDAWDIATGYFADSIHENRFTIRLYYLSFLANVMAGTTIERKKRLTDKLVKQYVACKPEELGNVELYTEAIFDIIQKSDSFEKYYNACKPIRFRNDYNKALISLLIEYGHLQLAEKYCREQIKGNYHEEYNVSYWLFLKEIYTIEKDDNKLMEVLKELFRETFNFDDFLFIYDRIQDEEEKKKWRTKMLARARQAASYDKNAAIFSFQLMDYEGKYKKMLEYVDGASPYSLIIKYAEKMIAADRDHFLKQLFYRPDYFPESSDDAIRENEEILFPALLGILEKHYTTTEIKGVISNSEKLIWLGNKNYSLRLFIRQKLALS